MISVDGYALGLAMIRMAEQRHQLTRVVDELTRTRERQARMIKVLSLLRASRIPVDKPHYKPLSEDNSGDPVGMT